MKKLIIFLCSILLTSNSFAWFGSSCHTKSIESSCIVVCYINYNVTMTKLHEGNCKQEITIEVFKDGE